jgi:hypothetical protein
MPEGMTISNEFVKSLSGLFKDSDNVFKKDCDGIVLFEHNNKCYCFLVELKSAFDTKMINRAQEQILSTYIKLNMSLGLLADYHKVEFIGIIASNEPDDDRLLGIENMSMYSLSDTTEPEKKQHIFPINLFKKKVVYGDYYLKQKGYNLNSNVIYEKMKYYYVSIPSGDSTHKINITPFL